MLELIYVRRISPQSAIGPAFIVQALDGRPRYPPHLQHLVPAPSCLAFDVHKDDRCKLGPGGQVPDSTNRACQRFEWYFCTIGNYMKPASSLDPNPHSSLHDHINLTVSILCLSNSSTIGSFLAHCLISSSPTKALDSHRTIYPPLPFPRSLGYASSCILLYTATQWPSERWSRRPGPRSGLPLIWKTQVQAGTLLQ